MPMKKNKKRIKFNLIGIILVFLLAVFVFVLLFVSYMYQDLKSVQQGVFNLTEEVKITNDKIDQFSITDEQTAQKSLKFTEATKKWDIYQNSEYKFQFKNPLPWGSFSLLASYNEGDHEPSSVQGLFAGASKSEALSLVLIDYDKFQGVNYASHEVEQYLVQSSLGECNIEIFAALKKLNLGEIRNCFVRENILNQKYLVYRYYKDYDVFGAAKNNLVMVYPRENFYVYSFLKDDVSAEVDYFIQSLVFMH